MAKRYSSDDRGDGRNNKRRKSNDGRGIGRNTNAGSNNDGCSVFVGNLKYETSWQDLKDHMRQAGNVDSANILEAPNGRSKGCAVVKYQHFKEAQRAIQDLNESQLDGRTIFVQPDNGNPRDSNNGSSSNDSQRFAGERNSDPPSQYGVYVGNLPYECSWQALKDFFKSCGFIERAEVAEDPSTGRKKGYGMVYFSNERAMDNAIRKFDGRDFQGRNLEVRRDKKSPGNTSSGNRNINSSSRISENGEFKVYFGNLDFDCSWQDLKDLVQKRCGRVERTEIPKRGWGLVTFATRRDAAAAISAFDKVVFKNRALEVRWDRDKSSSSNGRDERNNSSSSSSSTSKQLYVGNLPYECSWQDLKDAFKRFGSVSHAEVCETSNGKTTGFGIVAFVKPSSAEQALKSMDGADFQGRSLSVRWDRKPQKLEAEKNGSHKRNQKSKTAAKTTTEDDDMKTENEEEKVNPLDMALSSAR
jgi:RNA recognition motif-containing protein